MTTSASLVAPHLGILAGGGSVPGEIAAAARARGWPVHVVAIDGEADASFDGLSLTRVNWGQIGGMLRAFRRSGVTHLVIVGRVRRPDLTRLKPDFGLIRAIPAILRILSAGGDDGVLRGVVRFFEHNGLKVIGPLDVAPQLALAPGAVSDVLAGPDDATDIARGLDLVRALGPYDVGQGVVVRGGTIVAIEGAEGTDGMLARVTPPAAGRRGVLVKRPKPQQDMRVDVPVIGPETVSNAARAGLAGVAVLSGHVMITQRDEVERRAHDSGLFVTGVADDAASPSHVTLAAKPANDDEDITRGLALLDVLRPHVACRAVVVARKYVLALESGEGTAAVLERAASLRQWGSQRVKKRLGVAVLAAGEPLGLALVHLAVRGGLRGIAVRGTGATPDVLAAADAAGLFVRVLDTGDV